MYAILLSKQPKRKRDESNDKKAIAAAAPRGTRRRVQARREDEVNIPFIESSSTRERAYPFLLAVTRMPVDVLDTAWSVGRNRPINAAHVQGLVHIFRSSGLEQRAPENRIVVLCNAEENNDDGPREVSFLRWAEVNGSKAEVLAGQHRIQALREYVKETGTLGSDLWWVCELYDRGGRDDEELGGEDAAQHIIEALCLSSEKHFLTRRLITLWNHRRWRPVITQCLRIDEYWINALNEVLSILANLLADERDHITPAD
ncbi:hypothetical protein CCHR01_15810 [Colletotrichum chrysophilum]|uniref:Uncharacterized protein n=1 Tax=Colletotrichum chrysophilum TaxID=1836956 RepID=A0AAD9EE63_9PEZI|nr:hypothetical protein CCHR01_15810 [Colletotrichum chrysophilum]